MAKDINIHIKAEGVENTKEQIRSVGDTTKQAGEKIQKGGQDGAGAIEQLSSSAEKSKGAFGGFIEKCIGWAAALKGVLLVFGEIKKAMDLNRKEVEENSKVVAEQQKELLRLQGLGEFYKGKPELRKEVADLAEYGRRPFEEVSNAYYNLRSKGGELSDAQQRDIMVQALEMGRLDPNASLDTLVDMFTLYAKQSKDQDANRIQNVLQQTVVEAGGGTGDVAKYMPQFLPSGMAGGLTAAQAAGLWAWATTQTAEASTATTGLRALFAGLQGKGTPESAEMLTTMGITPEMDFWAKIGTLSQQRAEGKFGLGEAETLAGREGASLLLSMLNNPQGVYRVVGKVTGANRGDVDIVKRTLEGLMGSDERAALEEELRLLNVKLENKKGEDTDSLKWKILKERYDIMLREKGVSPYGRYWQMWWVDQLIGLGVDPDKYFGRSEEAEAPPQTPSEEEKADIKAQLRQLGTTPEEMRGLNTRQLNTLLDKKRHEAWEQYRKQSSGDDAAMREAERQLGALCGERKAAALGAGGDVINNYNYHIGIVNQPMVGRDPYRNRIEPLDFA